MSLDNILKEYVEKIEEYNRLISNIRSIARKIVEGAVYSNSDKLKTIIKYGNANAEAIDEILGKLSLIYFFKNGVLHITVSEPPSLVVSVDYEGKVVDIKIPDKPAYALRQAEIFSRRLDSDMKKIEEIVKSKTESIKTVSYTHLTLPTILLV